MNAKIQPDMPMLLFKKYPSGGIVSPFEAVLTFTCLKKTHFNHQIFKCLHILTYLAREMDRLVQMK